MFGRGGGGARGKKQGEAEMVLQSVRRRSLFFRFFASLFWGVKNKIKKIGGKFIRWTPYIRLILVEISGWLGAWLVAGLGFGGVVLCVPR